MADDWLETLPALADIAAPALYPDQAPRNVTAGLATERTLRRPPKRRRMLNALKIANAARALDVLPASGEAIHIVMAGNFDCWDCVPAILRLAHPATIAELNVATLGFNARNTDDLLLRMDSGEIDRVSFVASHFFRYHNVDEWTRLYRELHARGHRCAALRSHAKVLVFRLTDGRELVLESSANLRSCRNAEQACLTSDSELAEFHRDWMLELLTQAEAGEER